MTLPRGKFVDSEDDRIPNRRFEKSKMDLRNVFALEDLADWKFYTPAVIYLYGGFTDEMLASHSDTLTEQLVVGHYRFEAPIFKGLTTSDGDTAWNNVLWATPLEQWPALENHILSVLLTSAEHNYVCDYGAQDIKIVDPLQVQEKAIVTQPSTIDIVSFGTRSNKSCIAMGERTNIYQHPSLKAYPADDNMLSYAKKNFTSPIGKI